MKKICLVVFLAIIWQSTEAQTFELIKNPLSLGLNAKFEEVNSGDVAFGDVDGDGDQDVIIVGQIHYTQGVYHTVLYKNDGVGNFEEFTNDFIGMGWSSVAFGDVDGDGDIDLIMTGSTDDQDKPLQTVLYLNDGTGVFAQSVESFIGTDQGDIAFNDVDDDGDLDVILTGMTLSSQVTILYKNDGAGHFAEATTDFVAMQFSTIDLGDVDGDGDDDLLISGLKKIGGDAAFLYLNDGSGVYSQVDPTPFYGAHFGTVKLVDIDGDSDLDALISGTNGGSNTFQAYKNDGTGHFTQGSTIFPNSKTFFAFEPQDFDGDGDVDLVSTGGVFLNNGSGDFTLSTEITYRALSDGAVAISDVNADGLDDVIFLGRDGVFNHTSLYIHGAGHSLTEVTENYFSGLSQGEVQLVDIDGDGDLDIVANGKTEEDTYHGVLKTYTNDGLGNFTEFDAGLDVYEWEVIVVLGDLDGDGDLDAIVGDGSYNSKLDLWLNDGAGHFTSQLILSSENTNWYGLDLNDFDGDGDLDLFYIAYNNDNSENYTRLLKNDGNAQFSNVATGLPSRNIDVMVSGDIDDDGDMDVILNARGGSGYKMYICTNNGQGVFTEAVAPSISAKIAGTLELADIDGDSDLDLYVSGQNYVAGVSADIYKNDGAGHFAKFTSTIGVNFGSAKFGDMDADGDLDLMVTGSNDSGGQGNLVARLYSNDGLAGFSVGQDEVFTNVVESATAIGDIDGNGVLDIVMIGSYKFGSVFHIYKNQLSPVFLSENEITKEVTLFPNPTSNIIQFRSKELIVSLCIYNQLGQIVLWQKNTNELDVSSLNTGVYFCELQFLNGVTTIAKLVKE